MLTLQVRSLLALALLALSSAAVPARAPAAPQQAQRVTITRDIWGIAHVRGRTDADAVFGMIYAQAEDDFNRIETNYLVALGRLAEAQGEKAIWQDLRARLYADPDQLRRDYAASPAWLRKLMDSWAAGLNHYLATHTKVKPRAIARFEPWMALAFSEGSIGGDIEKISLAGLEAFYGRRPAVAVEERDHEPRGSNGIAIAPAITANGAALLLINPHTSFFFRSEVQMTSDEGLNAYGAATWGQFFIYQGFNRSAGWMHTSSGADVVDEFAETVTGRGTSLAYRYGKQQRAVSSVPVTIAWRAADGTMRRRAFITYRTHHGPIVRADGDKWIAVAMMHRPVAALSQSFARTKAANLAAFLKVAELQANSSNNTLFADAQGNIAYLHPQFIPRRDDRFDYSRPVDGSDPATDWRGLHAAAETPRVINPANGWAMNTNNWPYSAAGVNSPRASNYPRYMDSFGENPRGVHASMLLEGRSAWTIERLRAAAYDSLQPGFARLVPELVRAYDRLPRSSPLARSLGEPVALLRTWDYRWSTGSVANSLAVYWAEQLTEVLPAPLKADRNSLAENLASRTSDAQKLAALTAAVARLERDFGTWRTPWGEINRFQRLTGDISHPFSDSAPSIPVGFSSAVWGSLASFGTPPFPGAKRRYGTNGNSFVAVVEFGKRVKAIAVSAGGASGDPASPHFNDQAARYAGGDLRPVYFHPDELAGHVRRRYRPGQ